MNLSLMDAIYPWSSYSISIMIPKSEFQKLSVELTIIVKFKECSKLNIFFFISPLLLNFAKILKFTIYYVSSW